TRTTRKAAGMAHEPQSMQHTVEPHGALDEWHHHAPAEGRPQHEHAAKIDPVALSVTFGVIVVVVVVLTGALYTYFRHYSAVLRQERIETTAMAAEALRLRAQAEARLSGYGWVDHERVSIPIDIAAQ